VSETKVTPLGARVLVKRDDAPEQIGSIIVPDKAKKAQAAGVVRAKGAGRVLNDGSRRPLPLAVGDRVTFLPYGGVEVEIGGEKLLMVEEGHLLGVWED
jgi:chaperonin GroES